MKRLLLCLILIFAPALALAGHYYSAIDSGGDYCSGISWPTLSDFTLDFDHTTDDKTSCGTNDEVGTLSNATIATPTLSSPGSGGDCLLADATGDIITFDNDGAYFTSQYGEIYLLVKLAGNNAADYDIINIIETAAEDRLEFIIEGTGLPSIYIESNNSGTIQVGTGGSFDFDNYYGDWVQVHIQWDSTRCTDGTCDGAGEDECRMRFRVDDNRDGDFSDGGVEDWSSWFAETSATNLDTWAAEPTTGDIKFGIVFGTHNENIEIDDIEISNSQPSW